MSTNQQVTPAPNKGVINRDDYIRRMQEASQRMAAGDTNFLKFSKGEYLLGREEDTFPDNKFTAVVAIQRAVHGWQCWKAAQVADEIWKPIIEDLPAKDELPDHGPYAKKKDGWQKSVKIELVILPTRPGARPIKAVFNTSSRGGQQAISKLCKDFAEALAQGRSMDQVPYCTFDRYSYEHNEYGKVWNPKITVEKWLSPDEFRDLIAATSAVRAAAAASPAEGVKKQPAPQAPAPARAPSSATPPREDEKAPATAAPAARATTRHSDMTDVDKALSGDL